MNPADSPGEIPVEPDLAEPPGTDPDTRGAEPAPPAPDRTGIAEPSGGLGSWIRNPRLADCSVELAALAAVLLAVLGDSPLWALPPAVAAVGLLGWTWRGALHGHRVSSGGSMVARLLLLTCAYVVAAVHGGLDVTLAVGITLAVLAILGESLVAVLARSAQPVVANLPGAGLRPCLRPNTNRATLVNGFVMVVALGCAFVGDHGVVVIVAAAAGVGLIVFTGVQLLQRALLRRGVESRLPAVVAAYQPVFLLYWQAAAGTEYQIGMWLPYLERLNKRFMVVVRSEHNFTEAVRLTNAPVLLCRGTSQLDAVIVPSLKAAFYVNNAAKNTHSVRYTQLKHIQLNHGDSDKVPSHNPVFRMYDKNFVAGQAAIDRFAANGVQMPAEMFTIVGRPQVENVAIAAQPISSIANPRVLYAPTWAGFHADSNYSSLLVGYDIIKALVARGCSVVFRPHPYSRRSPALSRECDRIRELLAEDRRVNGRPHVFGPDAEVKMSVVDCFNASDVLVSDVSSVVADYLYSEKPFAMVAVSAPASRFPESFPLARASYVIDAYGGQVHGVEPLLDDMLGGDPLAATRRELKRYYLGDIPAEGYAQRFLDEAARYL
ncbi:CDP-glycerol glycerophosphotransferase family protein [Micromonospora qiuiae]|uniref:CDP-glycerol glycerophosphotransferase family protein n=1 Tax=Micromonospora qiuiae TaxID=502268 RepID=UPI001EF20AEA|nr:CDP-glycerol glycerophosphotransferase family protein [Micromonospora qiuiae]